MTARTDKSTYFVTVCDTEHYEWVALGATAAESRQAWSEAFKRHVMSGWGESDNETWEEWCDVEFDGDPIDYYAVRTYAIRIGQALRDGAEVPV